MQLAKNSCLAFLALSILTGTSGCADYMNHRDSVTLGAGNALEGNIALNTIDPFPANASDTDIDRLGSEVVKKKVVVVVPGAPAATPTAK